MTGRLEFTVIGLPVGKGSKKAFAIPGRDGARPRAVIVDDNKDSLKDWERTIRAEALLVRHRWVAEGRSLFLAPGSTLTVHVLFLLPRPASVSAKSRPLPGVKPDLDKLTRAAMDPLSKMLFNDDAQIVQFVTTKIYAPEGTQPLAVFSIGEARSVSDLVPLPLYSVPK